MDRFRQNMDNAESRVSKECVKYEKIYYKSTVPDSRMLVFLAGFCLGMVFFYLSGITLAGERGLPSALSESSIAKLCDFDFYAAGLFEYAAYKRLGQLVFMLICATSFLKTVFSYAILGWGGFELGIMMFTFVYYYGLKGLFFSIMFLVPHGLFFLAVFLLLFHKNSTGDKRAYHNYEAITEKGLHNKLAKVKKAVVILAFWSAGILTEVYINPEIIKKMALFFK